MPSAHDGVWETCKQETRPFITQHPRKAWETVVTHSPDEEREAKGGKQDVCLKICIRSSYIPRQSPVHKQD